jgi:ADP-ribosyl-[dinitrogen reductase] hydrolase
MFDRILGGLHGVAIGDSLGAPFEFSRASPKIPYTGILTDTPVKVQFQYYSMIIEPCSITDDTEMSIQLLKSILECGKYDEDNAIKKYLDWANLKATPLGKNTRRLMKGITTVKYFRKRQEKFETKTVESNGSLMRCYPLLILKDLNSVLKASNKDCTLTNNNNVNRECSEIYLRICHWVIFDSKLKIKCKEESIKLALKNAVEGKIINVSENKGWVVHALYVAIITFLQTDSFEEGMDYIAKYFIKGDTDTIMAITGGLLGSVYGYKKMTEEHKTSINIEKLYNYFNEQIEIGTKRPIFTKKLLIETLNFLEK